MIENREYILLTYSPILSQARQCVNMPYLLLEIFKRKIAGLIFAQKQRSPKPLGKRLRYAIDI